MWDMRNRKYEKCEIWEIGDMKIMRYEIWEIGDMRYKMRNMRYEK